MGSGGAEDRRSVTPNAKISDAAITAEDRAARAKSARACDLHLQDLVRYHGQGRKSHAGWPHNLDRYGELITSRE